MGRYGPLGHRGGGRCCSHAAPWAPWQHLLEVWSGDGTHPAEATTLSGCLSPSVPTAEPVRQRSGTLGLGHRWCHCWWHMGHGRGPPRRRAQPWDGVREVAPCGWIWGALRDTGCYTARVPVSVCALHVWPWGFASEAVTHHQQWWGWEGWAQNQYRRYHGQILSQPPAISNAGITVWVGGGSLEGCRRIVG